MLDALADYAGNLLMVALVSLLGTMALAGGRIAFQIMMFLFVLAMCFGGGVRILTGQCLGKEDYLRLRPIFQAGLISSLFFLMIPSAGLLLFPEWVLFAFIQDASIVAKTSAPMRILGICIPLMVGTTCIAGALRAYGKTKEVMFTNLLAIWLVQMPLAWLLGVVWGQGLTGIYLGYAGYFLFRGGMSYWVLFKTQQFQVTQQT